MKDITRLGRIASKYPISSMDKIEKKWISADTLCESLVRMPPALCLIAAPTIDLDLSL
jgi:hypothetical protein